MIFLASLFYLLGGLLGLASLTALGTAAGLAIAYTLRRTLSLLLRR